MKISVIIPTYKPGDYIKECLASLVNQTLCKDIFEIVIILNGCNEPFYSMISNYIKNYMSEYTVKLMQINKGGVSNARNIGIDNSIGEFLCFIDDDDVVSPNYLEELLDISSNFCIGCSNSYSFIDDIQIKNENFLSKKYLKCVNKHYSMYRFRGYLSPPFAKLIHRDIIGHVRFDTHLSFSEDSVFCFQIAPRIRRMTVTSINCIYYIRDRKGSVTRNGISISKYLPQFFRIFGSYIELYIKKPMDYELLFFASRLFAVLRHLWWVFIKK
ncbi:glycosyltransferase family A protein [uncultured Bacteroides sp.]|uniref:glycosyltransferase family 2 protein n=1 Tax=uncultured Bacteroides sp. TaxID=162156 RepID=UPI0025D831C7|nr:glycosyltransferase family A protein [uncultured Bacteroides sp.]